LAYYVPLPIDGHNRHLVRGRVPGHWQLPSQPANGHLSSPPSQTVARENRRCEGLCMGIPRQLASDAAFPRSPFIRPTSGWPDQQDRIWSNGVVTSTAAVLPARPGVDSPFIGFRWAHAGSAYPFLSEHFFSGDLVLRVRRLRCRRALVSRGTGYQPLRLHRECRV
jgi:hypothetical protein